MADGIISWEEAAKLGLSPEDLGIKPQAAPTPAYQPPPYREKELPQGKSALGTFLDESVRGVAPGAAAYQVGGRTFAALAPRMAPYGPLGVAGAGAASALAGGGAALATRLLQNRAPVPVLRNDEPFSDTVTDAALDVIPAGLMSKPFRSAAKAGIQAASGSVKKNISTSLGRTIDQFIGRQLDRMEGLTTREGKKLITEEKIHEGARVVFDPETLSVGLEKGAKPKIVKDVIDITDSNAKQLTEYRNALLDSFDNVHADIDYSQRGLPAPNGERATASGEKLRLVGGKDAQAAIEGEGRQALPPGASPPSTDVNMKRLGTPPDTNPSTAVRTRRLPDSSMPSTEVRRIVPSKDFSNIRDMINRAATGAEGEEASTWRIFSQAVDDAESLVGDAASGAASGAGNVAKGAKVVIDGEVVENPGRLRRIVGAIGTIDNGLKRLGAFDKAKLSGRAEEVASYGRKLRADLERGLVDETNRIQQAIRETREMGARLPDYAERLLDVEPDEILRTNRRIHANLTVKEGAEGWVVDRQKGAISHEGSYQRMLQPSGRSVTARLNPSGAGASISATEKGLPASTRAQEAAFLGDEDRTMKDLLAALGDKPNRFTFRPNYPGAAGTLARSALGETMLGGAKAAFEPRDANAEEMGPIDPLAGSILNQEPPQFAPDGSPMNETAAILMRDEAMRAKGNPMAESAINPAMTQPEMMAPQSQRQVAMPRESDAFFQAPDTLLPADLPQEARDLIEVGRRSDPMVRRQAMSDLMTMNVIPFEPPAHKWLEGFPVVDGRILDPARVVSFNEMVLEKEKAGKIGLKQSMKIRRAVNAGEPVIGFLTEVDPDGEVLPAQQPNPEPAPAPPVTTGEEGAKRRDYAF